MTKNLSLTGQRFGRLTVLGEVARRTKSGNKYYLCRCDCGQNVEVCAKNLRSGDTKSCGCLKLEIRAQSGKRTGSTNIQKLHEKDGFQGSQMYAINPSHLRSTNTSGHAGITWHKAGRKWQGSIMLRGKQHYLGLFNNISDAIKARKLAEEEYFQPIIDEYNAQKDGD